MNRTEHLLVILMEECSEVQKNASKALRFGLDDHAPDSHKNNAEMLTREIGDLYAAIQMLFDNGLIEPPFNEHINLKKIKVEKYLEYSKQQGTLTE